MRKIIQNFTRLLVVGGVCSLSHAAPAQMLSRVEAGSFQNAPEVKKQSLKKALNQLESRFKVTFAFDERLIGTFQVEDNLQGSDLDTILDRVLPGMNLKYQKINGTIYVIGEKNVPAGQGTLLNKNGDSIDSGSAQLMQLTITGRVSNDAGEGLPGVSILLKGTTTSGTVTDRDGKYALSLPDDQVNGILVFSFIGYTTEEVAIGNRTTVDVQLLPDIKSLSEVVVTGYSSQARKDITGSVAVVDVKALQSIPTGSAVQALQGQAPGVTVISSGAPGGRNDIFIRGVTSFGNTQPLILVDGVQVQGGLNDININDIESIQVLKDAGAAAIYGVRGSNGVIVVTTKKGKSGKPTITYDGYYGIQTPPKDNAFNLVNSQDFAALVKTVSPGTELFANGVPEFTYAGLGISGTAKAGDPAVDPAKYNFDAQNPSNDYMIQRLNQSGTDWFGEIFNNAPMQSHNLTASGGTDHSSYLLSLGHLNQQGTLIETYLKRYSARINTEFKPHRHIRIGQNAYLFYKQNPGFNNQSEGNAISQSYRIMTVIPVRDIKGNYGGTWLGPEFGEGENSVAIQEETRNNKSNFWDIQGNVYAEVDLLKHITARTSFGGTVDNQYSYSFSPNRYHSKQDHNKGNSFSENSQYNTSYTWSNTLKYNNTFGKHLVSVLVGSEAIENSGRSLGGEAKNFFSTDPDYLILNNGTTNITNSSNAYRNTLFSLFTRLDYSYQDKYLLGATIRRDGSSVFGSDKRYGVFPSFSLGWRISGEGFMKNIPFINDLKLRGSYGILGSQANVSPANAFSLYSSGFGNSYYDITGSSNSTQQGFRQSRIGNPSTGWEKDVIANVGMDASIFNNTFDISVEWYKKSINGLLFPQPLPASTGGAIPPTINIGDIQNKGWDFSLMYRGSINTDFKYSVGANIGSYKNLVVNIPEPGYFDVAGSRFGTLVRNQEGYPVGSFFGYDVIGLFKDGDDVSNSPAQTDAAPGRFKYRDVNGDNKITPEDRTLFGDPNPDFVYGLNLRLSYKGFDFSTIFYGSQGNDVINLVRYYTEFMGTSVSRSKSNVLKNAWTPQNQNTKIPILESASSFSTNGTFNSYYKEDGSFLKLRSLILGYTIPPAFLEKYGVSKLRIYIQGANLFMINKYTGIDPELSGNLGGNQSSASFGIDYGNYPNNQRNFLLGLNLTF